MPFNLHPLVTTAEYLTHAQHALVLSAIWMGLALLAPAAISIVVAVAALIWTARGAGSYRAKPASRDPWGCDLTDHAHGSQATPPLHPHLRRVREQLVMRRFAQ